MSDTYSMPRSVRQLGAMFALALAGALFAHNASAAPRDVTLRWVPRGAEPVSGYKVYVSTRSGVHSHPTDVGSLTPVNGVVSYTVAGLDTLTQYYVVVTSYFESAESSPSNEIVIRAVTPEVAGVMISIPDGTDHPIVDPSGTHSVEAGGVPVVYSVSADPLGRIDGTGLADVDGDGAFETAFPVRGRIRGKHDKVRVNARMLVKSDQDGERTHLKAIAFTRIDAARESGELVWRGHVAGARVVDSSAKPTTSVAGSELGWRVSFSADGPADRHGRFPITGTLTLGSGKVLVLDGMGRFDTRTRLLSARLRSVGAERGAVFKLRRVAFLGSEIADGVLEYRAFGQRGQLQLP